MWHQSPQDERHSTYQWNQSHGVETCNLHCSENTKRWRPPPSVYRRPIQRERPWSHQFRWTVQFPNGYIGTLTWGKLGNRRNAKKANVMLISLWALCRERHLHFVELLACERRTQTTGMHLNRNENARALYSNFYSTKVLPRDLLPKGDWREKPKEEQKTDYQGPECDRRWNPPTVAVKTHMVSVPSDCKPCLWWWVIECPAVASAPECLHLCLFSRVWQ